MIGVIVNTLTVIFGSCLGMLLKKGIPEKISSAAMTAIGLCTIAIGVTGLFKGENMLVLIVSSVAGALVGTALNIDGGITRLGGFLSNRLKSKHGNITEGFVSGSLLFCAGAMTVVGSLNAGLTGDNTMIFTKSLLDLISSTLLGAALGIGVLFSAAFVFVFQGALVLLAVPLSRLLNTAAINEITCAGSLIVLALGLNLTGITKIKVANFFPAIVIAPFASYGFSALNGLLERIFK